MMESIVVAAILASGDVATAEVAVAEGTRTIEVAVENCRLTHDTQSENKC